jgi:hypothetical protein
MNRFGRTARSAYTILEMLLVMAVIVMAASLLIASIDGVRQAYRLPRAADELRGVLAGLRARAMDEATSFEFSFEPDGNVYTVRRAGSDAGAKRGPPSELELESAARVEFDQDEIIGEHELPAGLSLLEAGANAHRPSDSAANDRNAKRATVRFMADGSTTGLAFVLKDAAGGEVHFHVRGLTGAVKTSRKGADGKDIEP